MSGSGGVKGIKVSELTTTLISFPKSIDIDKKKYICNKKLSNTRNPFYAQGYRGKLGAIGSRGPSGPKVDACDAMPCL